MIDKPQFHWSGIGMYTRCPEQFRRRYILGESVRPGIALITGSSVHKAAEIDLTRKMETGKLCDVEEVKDAARDYLTDVYDSEDYEIRKDELVDDSEKKTKGAIIDLAIDLAELHHNELAPLVTPRKEIGVERPWVVDVNGYPYALAGQMDVDEGHSITDWKTSKQTPNQKVADLSMQITMYCMAKFALDGIMPTAQLGYVVKLKTPKTVMLKTTRTKDHFQSLLRCLERVCDAVDKEVFPFASAQSPNPWWCSEACCGYYNTCEGVCTKTSVSFE